MAKKPTNTRTIYRDSVTGHFVTPTYVRQNPRTTETEHRPTKKK